MKLVPDWKKGLRWWSVRIALAMAAIPPIWMGLPPDVKAMLPDDMQPWVLTIMALGAAAGRFVDQGDA